jgi:hypothetical protein
MDDQNIRSPTELRILLREDHDRLDRLFADLLSAFNADARDDAARLWSACRARRRADVPLCPSEPTMGDASLPQVMSPIDT